VNRCVGRAEALDGERVPMVFYLYKDPEDITQSPVVFIPIGSA
jgi:hypothetical protein